MQAIGSLAGGIAHDFNNLLTVILGYAQMLQSRIETGKPGHEEVAEIIKAGERAASLTRQLLTFSRKQVVQPRNLEINSVLVEMEKMLGRIIGESIRFETDLQPGLWTVRADPGQIQQVVMNLVLNARDATGEGGSLTIRTSNSILDPQSWSGIGVPFGEYVLTEVSDTGTGMTPEVAARLFEPFFTTKGGAHGTGLGLSTVYGIVKEAGGHVVVQTDVGRGTTFKVYLPRGPDLGASKPTAAAPEHAAGSGRESILIAEDETMVRNLISSLLTAKGYQVLCAHNGVEALELFNSAPAHIDLVITDVVMPGMGGVELARRLKTTSRKPRIMFISGYPDGALSGRGELTEEVPLLQKPFSEDELLRKVREILDGPATTSSKTLPA
jgi:CheY-like chemotaxis protein